MRNVVNREHVTCGHSSEYFGGDVRITIITMGTWGDVMPFIALGLGLKGSGYDVNLITSVDFESEISERGLAYSPVQFSFQAYVNSDDCKASLGGDAAATRRHQKAFFVNRRGMIEDFWKAAQDSDAIIYNPVSFPVYHIAEALNVPAIMASVSPWLSPTREFPYLFVATKGLGSFLNRMTYGLYRLRTHSEHKIISAWCRETLKTKPPAPFMNYRYRNGCPIPILYFYSPAMVPRPEDWSDNICVSGYWHLEAANDWNPPKDLETFLSGGPAPIYVGFGSMIGSDPEQLTDTVISALHHAGERAVICTGWGGMTIPDNPPAGLYFIESIPHDWIFPRVKALVHHGGAGTTWTGLRYGKPTLTCPISVDHPFWAERIHRLGVGPFPISQRPGKKMAVEELAEGIQNLIKIDAFRQGADVLAKEISKEDGIAEAVAFIKENLQST